MKVGFVLVNYKMMVKVKYNVSIDEAINEVENTIDCPGASFVGFPEETLGGSNFKANLMDSELVPCIAALEDKFSRLRDIKAFMETMNQDCDSLMEQLNEVDHKRRKLIDAVKNSRVRIEAARQDLDKIKKELGVE